MPVAWFTLITDAGISRNAPTEFYHIESTRPLIKSHRRRSGQAIGHQRRRICRCFKAQQLGNLKVDPKVDRPRAARDRDVLQTYASLEQIY